jgi:hypothetical protein
VNKPDALVVSVRAAPVALSVMVKVALGMTAPVSSVTVPVMIPVGAWAMANEPNATRNKANNIDTDATFDMVPSYLLKQQYSTQRETVNELWSIFPHKSPICQGKSGRSGRQTMFGKS